MKIKSILFIVTLIGAGQASDSDWNGYDQGNQTGYRSEQHQLSPSNNDANVAPIITYEAETQPFRENPVGIMNYVAAGWRRPVSIGLIVLVTPIMAYCMIRTLSSPYFTSTGIGQALKSATDVLVKYYPNISRNMLVCLGVLSGNTATGWKIMYDA